MNKTTKLKKLCGVAIFCFTSLIYSQVGVGTTTPRGALDVASSTQGFIPPQVALTDLTVEAPVVNPQGSALASGTVVWNTNTAGSIPNNVSPGMYYWDGTRWVSLAGSPGGLDWSIIGNGGIDGGITGVTGTTATQGANFIGTYDVTNFDIRTSGLHAARVSSLGEFFIGSLETVLPGDLMNGVSEGNAVFPWAVNGYTDQDGAGIYGSVTGGNTNYAAVQGEYYGTGSQGPGIRGLTFTSGTGSNYTGTTTSAINGQLGNSSQYSFGIFGQTLNNTSTRVGGVLGVYNNGGFTGGWGSLGYRSSTGNIFGVYANNTSNTFGSGGGRSSQNINEDTKTGIGIGANSEFIGAQINGGIYGLIAKGERFGSYTDGTIITNKNIAVITEGNSGNKIATYTSSSLTDDVSTKGMGQLKNGKANISFGNDFKQIISCENPIIVTVTPMGETNGVYVSEVTETGFTIKENNNGKSNTNFYWIAITERKNSIANQVPAEILHKDFDENIAKTMPNENNPNDEGTGMWWDGKKLNFGNQSNDQDRLNSNRSDIPKPTKRQGKRTPKKENLRASQLNQVLKANKTE